MAKKSPSFDDIASAFRKGDFKPLYFFYGEEGFFIDELQELLIQKALQPHEKDFNLDVFFGPEADARNVLAACGSFPMMAERRVIVVRAFESLADNDLFTAYAASPNPSAVVLLICQNKPNLTRNPYRALNKHAVSVAFKALWESDIPKWLVRRAKMHGLQLNEKAAQLLAQETGTNLRAADNELLKLKVYIGERTSISEDDVIQAAGQLRDFNVFELQKAIGKGDRRRATAIVDKLLQQAGNEQGEAIRMVIILSWYFQRLRMLAGLTAQRIPQNEFNKILGASPAQLKEFKAALSTLGPKRVRFALKWILSADNELKGGSDLEPRLILLLLIGRILGEP